MVAIKYTGDELWARTERAVERVKDRLLRVTQALDASGIPFAVIGGNAVQLWVAQVDETAIRNTRDVDVLLNRAHLTRTIDALAARNFHYCRVNEVDMFLDGSEGTSKDAVHIIFAGEKVRAEHQLAAPRLDEVAVVRETRTLNLEALVRMKLTSNRDKDRVHVRDLLDVGLIDSTWLPRFPPPLRERLQHLIDTPDG